MIGRVARRVHRHPLALAERDRLGVGQSHARARGGEPATHHRAEHLVLDAHPSGRTGMGAPPWRLAAPWLAWVGLRLVFELLLADIGWVPPRAERRRRHDLGTGLLTHMTRRAEVVDVRMRDDDRV